MANFEEQLMGGIPLHEAAEFFVRVKRPSDAYTKEASTKLAGAASDLMDQLAAGGPMPAGKAGKFKKVDTIKEAAVGASLKRGLNVLTGAPGRKARAAATKHKSVAGASEEELGDALKKTPFYRQGTRGELQDSVRRARAGRRAEAVAGREEARTRKAHMGLGAAGLGAAGAGLTMSKKDKMKQAAALLKIAFGEEGMGGEAMIGGGPNMQGGQPTPAAQGASGMSAPNVAGAPPTQDPEAAMPSSPPTLPVNYMAAEQVARAAQEANEVGFLRERLNSATEQNNALKSQLGDVQMQLDQLNQQSQQTGEQVMAATAEAVNASERALQQSMQAANMRIGVNKMREAFMQLASQEPEQLGTLAQQEQVQAEQAQQGAIDAQTGSPEQSSSPETGTESPSAEASKPGGSENNTASQPGKPAQPNISIKTGGVPWAVPGAVAGAGLAALHGKKLSQGTGELEQQVATLEQEQEQGSFGKAMELAKAKMRLAEAELHQKHPARANVQGVMGGAFGGAMVGSALQGLSRTAKHMA